MMSNDKPLRSRAFEKGSLCDLIASNPSCFSRIEDWESEQLKRLNCQVLPISDHSSTTNTVIPIEDGRIADTLDELSRERVTSRKDETARELFRLLVPVDQPAFGAKDTPLRLYFNRRPVARTPSPLLFRSKASPRPIFAFVDKTWLSERRYKVFKHRKTYTVYNKVQQMNKLEIDPYFAGLLISMAQNSCEFTTGDIIEVHLFSPSTNRKSLIQHSVRFLRQYLQKFDEPQKVFDCRFTITRKEIPFDQPHLIAQILHDMEENPENDAEKACKNALEPPSSGKRKAMSDVTNQYDISPPANLNTKTKRVRLQEDT